MKLIEVYIKKYDDEESDEPTSDVLCNVICLSPGTSVSKMDGAEVSDTYLSAYCFDPTTGEVANVKLEHLIIKSYQNAQNQELTHVSSPLRVIPKGEENPKRDNHP